MNDIQTGSPSPHAPDQTPAAVALREEAGKLMRDPNWGKDPALTARRDKLYADHYGSGTVEMDDSVFHFRESTENPGDALSEAVAVQNHNNAVLSKLESMYGSPDIVEQVKAGASKMFGRLFPDEASRRQGVELANRISAMGPNVEAAAIAWLHQHNT